MIEPTKEAWQPLLEKKLPALLHVLAWGIYAILVFYGNFARMSPEAFFVHYGLAFGMHAGSFYLNYAYLVPKVLPRHSLMLFLAINTLIAVAMAVFVVVSESFLLPDANFVRRVIGGDLLPLFTKFTNYAVFAFFGLSVRLSVDWYKKLRNDKERENERLKSELAVLKAQINPHFLFNSLNNLYALSLRQAPETPSVILNISEMMRYLLYDANAEMVLLDKEIEMIRTYVIMNEMRSKSVDGIKFETSGEMGTVMVPPLLLLPVVENVFKHGTPPITISITLDANLLRVYTSNKVRARGPDVTGGIGIANLRRRLALLYKDAHQLTLSQERDLFIADFWIQLKKPTDD